jgi:hypothetical protein
MVCTFKYPIDCSWAPYLISLATAHPSCSLVNDRSRNMDAIKTAVSGFHLTRHTRSKTQSLYVAADLFSPPIIVFTGTGQHRCMFKHSLRRHPPLNSRIPTGTELKLEVRDNNFAKRSRDFIVGPPEEKWRSKASTKEAISCSKTLTGKVSAYGRAIFS